MTIKFKFVLVEFTLQQRSFEKLKSELTADRVMAYFDPNKETVLIVDASPVGLAALLTQDKKSLHTPADL
jgi:hypothetical protein